MRIKTVEMYTLNIPFYCDRVSKHMHRALTHSERVYVYRTELENGIVGYGENLSDESSNIAVSYTHLTLPTNREV